MTFRIRNLFIHWVLDSIASLAPTPGTFFQLNVNILHFWPQLFDTKYVLRKSQAYCHKADDLPWVYIVHCTCTMSAGPRSGSE